METNKLPHPCNVSNGICKYAVNVQGYYFACSKPEKRDKYLRFYHTTSLDNDGCKVLKSVKHCNIPLNTRK